MAESQGDFGELLQLFNAAQVEFIVIGSHAVMKYTEPRYTKDLDLWVSSSPVNAQRVYDALSEFGAPLTRNAVTPDDFTREVIYQIGVAPIRIDILTHIPGIRFEEAWPRRVQGDLFGVPVNFLALDDLISAKQAAGRTVDALDLEQLTTARRYRSRQCPSPESK